MSDGDIFEYEHLDGVLVLVPQGDLFQYRFEALRNGYNETYRMVSQDDVKHLLIDFRSTGHFGSAFVGMLIKLAKAVRSQGGEAALCGLTEDMREVLDNLMLLENVRTDFFWVPFDTRPEAIAFVQSKSAD